MTSDPQVPGDTAMIGFPYRSRRSIAALILASLALQSLLPMPARGAYDDYDALVAQLNGLVGQRSTMLAQLEQADGTAGALVARDALAALVPALDEQVLAARLTTTRALSGYHPRPIVAAPLDRSDGPGLLFGAHLPAVDPLAAPATGTPIARSWSEAVLKADALAFAPALAGASLQTGSVPVLAPVALTPSPTATTAIAALGDGQDTQPVRALELDGGEVPLVGVAPQARILAPALHLVAAPIVPTPAALHGAAALEGYTRAAIAQHAALAALPIPDGLPSAGLDPRQRVTQVGEVEGQLGHYTLTASPGGAAVQINAPGFLAPQVTWTFSATTPLRSGSVILVGGGGHADGGSLHDLSMHAETLRGVAPPAARSPGTSLSLALSPDGAAELTAVTMLTDTTTITTLARIDGVGNDLALQSAQARERLALTELSGVLQAGNAVYARLQPLYQLREQLYTQALAVVMARNSALEQVWWAREEAWRSYQIALAQWQQRRGAWTAYLARRQHSAGASPSPQPSAQAPTVAPDTATPVPTSTLAGMALPLGTLAPATTGTPQAAPGGIFGQGNSPARPAGAAGRAVAPAAGITPIFGVPPTATGVVAVPSDSPAATSAVNSPTATPTPPLGAPSVVISPSATSTPIVLPSPLPIADSTPTTGPTPGAAPAPPGPPPAPVPPPGLEPVFSPLPAPVAPLPPWVDAPPPALPRSLSSTLSHGLDAFGYANMTAEQLIAGGALDGLSGFIPPIHGVITTYWGGSTPWQSFHTGVDIAAPMDTPVHAAAAGIVIYAGLAVPGDPTLSYGNCVMILHNNHLSTLYGHMDMGAHGLQVVPGQVVQQGQVIGYEGETGWATGPHVHFEMRLDNVQFDPLLLLDERAITG